MNRSANPDGTVSPFPLDAKRDEMNDRELDRLREILAEKKELKALMAASDDEVLIGAWAGRIKVIERKSLQIQLSVVTDFLDRFRAQREEPSSPTPPHPQSSP